MSYSSMANENLKFRIFKQLSQYTALDKWQNQDSNKNMPHFKAFSLCWNMTLSHNASFISHLTPQSFVELLLHTKYDSIGIDFCLWASRYPNYLTQPNSNFKAILSMVSFPLCNSKFPTKPLLTLRAITHLK